MSDDELITKWKDLKGRNPERILHLISKGDKKGIIDARVFYREDGRNVPLWEWSSKKIVSEGLSRDS